MTPTPLPPGTLASANQDTVCIGDGLDASVDGLLATIVLSTVIGLLIWLLFATLRPKFRQVYGLREWWFLPDGTRPKPLRNTFWAFLSPPVPLVPSMPKDVSDAGTSPATDAKLFPSDEQLVQRTLYHCFRIVLGWSILGLIGAIPLYLISMPCLSNSASEPQFGGAYSTLNDLSIMRLLKLLQNDSVTTSTHTVGVVARAIVDGEDEFRKARVRVIILAVFTIVLGVLPALYKLLKEYNRLLKFRRRWTDIYLQGVELGWLGAKEAPGFSGWGERRVKDFIHRTGLGSSLLGGVSPRGNGHDRQEGDALLHHGGTHRGRADDFPEVDLQGLFSIGDTDDLAHLIEERDIILEQLEMAETKYIKSFRISTPEPSIADFEPQPMTDVEGLPHISRPRPLQSGRTSRRRRDRNPAYGSSSLSTPYAPTSYIAPSQYYKVGIRGVNGSNGSRTREPSLAESISQRIVGTRFQEMSRSRSRSLLGLNFPLPIPLGSRTRSDIQQYSIADEPEPTEPIPDPARFGPNYVEGSPQRLLHPMSEGGDVSTHKALPTETDATAVGDGEWVDVSREPPIDFSRPSPTGERTPEPAERDPLYAESVAGTARASTLRFIRRPKIFGPTPSDVRESIPLRPQASGSEAPPPHLRVQRAPPFVRPLTGFDHDALGGIYADIRMWRTRLKAINQEIAGAQADGYADIADGARIRGWLIVGRGVRFLPGIELIEGRSKEDIRWDLLQAGEQEKSLRWAIYWIAMAMSGILLAVGLLACVGLALAPAPNYAHYLTFLGPLANNKKFTSGLATVLAPSVAATLFIIIAVGIVKSASRTVPTVSVSAGELLIMKTLFYIILAVAVICLITVGSVLYAFGALSLGTSRSQTVADGSVYISILVLAIILNFAFIAPGLLMLQPLRLRRVLRAQKAAVTPRQRFRALYPRTYSPIFALSCSILAFAFASTFSIIFPLIGPAICVLLGLTLVAHRFLVGYVYGRLRSQTGGLLQIWLTKRFASVLALQPLLMGLELLSRELWPEGGTLVGAGVVIVLLVETFAWWKERRSGYKALHPVTREALAAFYRGARPYKDAPYDDDDEAASAESSHRTAHRTRGSFASVLDMMSQTLAVHPSAYERRGPVPLQTETLDDLVACERAARTHPDAPPRLPPLFADPAEDTSQVLYAPELVAPEPAIWLPQDEAGVAQSEAHDLEHYHALRAVLDVRTVTPAQAETSVRRMSAQH